MLNEKQTGHLTLPQWKALIKHGDEQKRAEQQLKASEESFRVLAETVPQLVWTTQPDGLHAYTNQHWRDYTGLTLEHVQSDRWDHLQFIHPDDRAGNQALWQHALDTGTMYEYEERLRNGQNGEYRWFLTRAMLVRDDTGQIVKWFGTGTDIENQKRTEEALRQSQERIRALIDSNIIGITSVEMEGEVLADANEAFLRMTGYTREEVQSRTLSRVNVVPPEQAPLFERSIQELTARGQHTPFETELVCQDGSRLPVLVGGVIFQEQPRQMVAFMLDNSARKELEQRKDDFISMANHELKTPAHCGQAADPTGAQTTRKALPARGGHRACPGGGARQATGTPDHRVTGCLQDAAREPRVSAGAGGPRRVVAGGHRHHHRPDSCGHTRR